MQNQENIIILQDKSADKQDKNVVLDENTIILAAGDTYSLIDMAALEEAVERSGMSYQDISDKAKISISSIYKFFSKSSKSPTFYNVVMIIKAIGASVDELCGLKQTRNTNALIEEKDRQIAELAAQRDRYRDHFTKEIEEVRRRSDERLHEKQETIDKLTYTNRSQFRMLVVVFIVIGIMTLVDALFGGFGWIRYDGGLFDLLF